MLQILFFNGVRETMSQAASVTFSCVWIFFCLVSPRYTISFMYVDIVAFSRTKGDFGKRPLAWCIELKQCHCDNQILQQKNWMCVRVWVRVYVCVRACVPAGACPSSARRLRSVTIFSGTLPNQRSKAILMLTSVFLSQSSTEKFGGMFRCKMLAD